MARVDVVMPQMGESIAEGTLSKWLKKVGDPVKRDEPMFEISTDKVDAEIPAPTTGVLAEVLVTEGQTVPVQTVVARLETDVAAGVGAASAAPAPASTAAAGAAAKLPAASGASSAQGAGGPPRNESAPAQAPAPHPSSAAPAQSLPTNGASSLEDRLRTKSSPLVRRMAADHGVELSALHGTGISGRVTKRDLLDYLESGPKTPARGGAPAATVHAGPLPEAWAGRPRRADVQDAAAHKRAHGDVAPYLGARQLVLRGRFHAHRAYSRQASRRIRAGDRREAHVPAVHHQVRGRRAARASGAQRLGARQRDHLPQAGECRDRRGARLGADRSGNQERG